MNYIITNRNNISINFINNKSIYLTIRNNTLPNELLSNNFNLFCSHKFNNDKYTKYSNCQILIYEINELTFFGKLKFETTSDIKKEDLIKYIRKNKLDTIKESCDSNSIKQPIK